MNDNDIIKMIEYCFDDDAPCEGCPLYDDRFCKTEILKSALDLINRQKAEIEALKLINSTYEVETKRVRDIAIEEVEAKLKSHKRRMCGNDNGGLYWDQAVLVDDIDRVMKEMTEEQE